MANNVLKGRSRAPGSRDREIYLKIAGGACTQREAASEFGVSQPRIFQIVKRVEGWIAKFVSKHARKTRPPVEQLNIARGMYLYAVDTLWRESMAKWHKSREDVVTYKEWEKDGRRFTEMTKRPGRGKIEYLALACRCCEELARVQGLEEENDNRPVVPRGSHRSGKTAASPLPAAGRGAGGEGTSGEATSPRTSAPHPACSSPPSPRGGERVDPRRNLAKQPLNVLKTLSKSTHNEGAAKFRVASAVASKRMTCKVCEWATAGNEVPKTFSDIPFQELTILSDVERPQPRGGPPPDLSGPLEAAWALATAA